VLDVDLPQGNPNIDYGWSLLPGGESYVANNDALGQILEVAASLGDVFISFSLTYIAQYFAFRALGKTGVAVWLAIGLYVAFGIVDTAAWYLATGQNSDFWLSAFFLIAAVTMAGCFITNLIESVGPWLTSIARFALGKIDHVMQSMWAKGLGFLDITGVAFLFADLAFMVSYLALYKASLVD